MLPEDCYMEMYMKSGKLTRGFFWATTDEFDERREGYTCGYFVLPMTEIIHEDDSITFKLRLLKTKDGDILNNFVKAPVDYHIRSWQEALTYYQIWTYFNSSLKEEIHFVI